MGTEVEQRGPAKAPKELEPLAKLAWQIRLNKYKLTARETEALQKCFDDGRWYFLNGAVLSGAVMWTFTGMGRKLKLVPRVIVTVAAAVIGRDIGGRFAGNSCMRTILSLEGSPLRGELIAILQEEYPNHPLLKLDLGQHEGSLRRPAIEPEDYAQEAHEPLSSKDWELETEDSSAKTRDWREMLGRDGGFRQERNRRIPRIWENSDKKEDVTKEFNGADVLADPFDLVMQTGAVDDVEDVDDAGGKEEDQTERPTERRRSRMSAKERREYDRRQYEQRQEQRTYYE